MKRFPLGAAALAAALFAGSAAAQTVLSFSSWVPRNHPINTYIFEVWGAQVEKATQGRVKMQFLPKAIAAPNQHYDAVVKGQVDMAYSTYGYQPERFMPFLIAELPQLGDTAVHNGIGLWRTYKSHIEKIGIHKDVELMGVMTHGPGMLHHSKKFVMLPDDLKGQKIRVGGDVPKAIVEAFGGVVITQPAPKSYEILSQGIADGIMFPTESLKSFNIAAIVPRTTFVKGGLYSSSFWFAMNKDTWAKIPKVDQDLIRGVSGEAFARMGGAGWDRADKEGLDAMKVAKGEMKEVSPAFVTALQAVTAKLETDYAARLDGMGLNGREVIKVFRANVAAVAAGK